MGVFHLPSLRDSGNLGWVVNLTWFFGSFHWKISGQIWTSEKVVPFSRWEFSDGTVCSIYGFHKGFFFQFQAALDHIFGKEIWQLHQTYHFGVSYMNHTNAKTCLSRGIGGLPNACCWGTLPVACTSRHRSSKVPRVILNWLSNSSTVYAGKILSWLKTLISVKIAPHIGCNRRQDRNEMIVWSNKTLFFQREV